MTLRHLRSKEVDEMNDRTMDAIQKLFINEPWRITINTDIDPDRQTISGGVVAWHWSIDLAVEHAINRPPYRAESRVTFDGFAPTLAEASATTRRILDMLPGGSPEAQL